jgi:hypothetical protein
MKPPVIGAWERVLVLAPHTDDGEFGGRASARVEGEGGNREGPPVFIRRVIRGVPRDMCGGRAAAILEEGGPRGKHVPRANSASPMCA